MEHELVYHPRIGICEITDYDTTTERITLTSIFEKGNQSTFPYESMKMVGIREIITKQQAQTLLEAILHPSLYELEDYKPANRRIEESIHGHDMDDKAAMLSYLLYTKYTKGKIGVILQNYLGQLEDILYDELSYVLDIHKKELESHLMHCYCQLA